MYNKQPCTIIKLIVILHSYFDPQKRKEKKTFKSSYDVKFDLGLWIVLSYNFFYYVLLSLFHVNFIVFHVFNIIVFLWGLMFKIHNLLIDHWISSFNGRPFHVHLRVSFHYSFSQEFVHGLWTQRFSPSYLFPWSSN